MCNSSFECSWFFNCRGHFGAYAIVITTVLCFFVGTPVHCWSLWVSLHGNIKPNLVFPLNITIVELLLCIQCFIDFIALFYSTTAINYLFMFVIGLGWTCRPIIQICMCIEQYLAVIHPVTFLRYKGIHYRTGSAGAAWLIALANGLRLSLLETYNFPDHIFFLLFCIAVTTVSFCCISVLCALKRPGPGDRNNGEDNRQNKTDRVGTSENQQKRKAFRKISHILMSILICYIFLVVTYFMIIAKIDVHVCETVPLILSFAIFAVFVSSMVRVYGAGHLKLMKFSELRKQIKGK